MYLETDFYEMDSLHQYFVVFYHSVMMLIGGEIGPRILIDYIFNSLTLLIGALITAVLFGNMAVLMAQLNRKSTQFQEKQDISSTIMKNMKLPEDI